MPTQAEEHRTTQPEEESASSNPVSSRVSELLDNATVAPDDDFARETLARDERAQNANVPDAAIGTAPQVEATGADAADHGTGDPGDSMPSLEDQQAAETGADIEAEPNTEDKQAAVLGDSDRGDIDPAPVIESTTTEEQRVDDAADDAAPEPIEERIYSDNGDQMSPATVRIRGRPGGVLVEIEDEEEWDDILDLLEERLAAAEGFFRGGKAVVEVGSRDVYEDELRQARDMLARHDMTLAVVRSTSDLTLQSSLLLGLSTSNQTEGSVETDRDMAPVVPITQPKSPYFVHNGTLRSGQVLRKSESIMIVGDVNPGAKVISGGDVMVWGRLRGMAYAGASGNKDARVAAIEFAPTQLRIASVTAVPPDAPKKRRLRFWRKPVPQKRPEVAHVADGRIVVEPWDDSRPGRPRVARK